MDMAVFISLAIEDARDISLEAGQEKYRVYLGNPKLAKYKEDVDFILTVDGYSDCIITL